MFLYGFPKNDKANLTDLELDSLKKLASIYLRVSDVDIEKALTAGEIKEVNYVKQKI